MNYFKTENLGHDISGELRTKEGAVINTTKKHKYNDSQITDRKMAEQDLLRKKQQWIDNTRMFDHTSLIIVMDKKYGVV